MCGFVGMVSHNDAAPEIHLALQALQHRGQDSAGIAAMSADGQDFLIRRALGTVTQGLGAAEIAAVRGPVGIGHVRYPTIGRGSLEDAQPFFYRQPGILMAHNGNVTNYDALRAGLLERSIHLLSKCDIEPALCELADALMQRRRAGHTIADATAAVTEMQRRVQGAFTVAAALMLDGEPTLMVARDRNGIRPGVIGRRDDGAWIAASESVPLDVLGFTPIAEPAAGEVVFLRAGAEPIRETIAAAEPAPCVFEFVYFARPDSVIEGRSVYEVRLGFGRSLAERIAQKGIAADVVIPVPDTSRPAAAALGEALGLPVREGLIKNRYSGRTFIMPDQLTRATAMKLKLNTLPGEIRGRRVLLIDDSIVRGTTIRRVLGLVHDAGAAEVHLAIHSPPVRHPCFYGIDMSTEAELYARQFDKSLEDLETRAAADLGADSLTFLSVDGLDQVFAGARCAACFDGDYPQPVAAAQRDSIVRDRNGRPG